MDVFRDLAVVLGIIFLIIFIPLLLVDRRHAFPLSLKTYGLYLMMLLSMFVIAGLIAIVIWILFWPWWAWLLVFVAVITAGYLLVRRRII